MKPSGTVTLTTGVIQVPSPEIDAAVGACVKNAIRQAERDELIRGPRSDDHPR